MKEFFEIYWFEEVSSTMEIAKKFAKQGKEIVALAEKQISGRGRLGRFWHSPEGGLWLSISLVKSLLPEVIPLLTYVASLATLFAIEEVAKISPSIKWPNDILYKEKKLAGILLERGQDYVILGIGINVNNPLTLEENKGTSLKEVLGREVDRLSLLTALLKSLKRFLTWKKENIISLWETKCATLGKKVKVLTSYGEITGVAKGLSKEGALLVIDEKNEEKKIFSGDCIHLF